MIRTAAASLPSTRAITRVAVAHTQTAVAAALPAAALPATHCSSRGLASRASAAAAAAPRAPSRAQLLSTYRLLRRSIFQSFYTASQYASYDELARDSNAIAGRSPGAAYRKEAFAKESNQPHLAFARKRSEPWMKQLKDAFVEHREERDPATRARLHRHADEMVQLMTSNMEHSRYLLEGGWGIRRNNARTLSNVAQKVGLQMPKETAHVHHEPAGNKHHKARDSKLHFHDKFEK